jgi:integrase
MPREFKFEIRKDKTRTTSAWWIDIPPRYSETGRRQKRFFKTLDMAKGELQSLKARVANHGISSKLLGAAFEEQAAAALALLKEAGLENRQLVTIVADYIERERERTSSVTLLECFNSYIARAVTDKKSDEHIRGLKATKKLCEPLHARLLPDIAHSDVLGLLEGFTRSTHNLKLRQLRAVFNYAMEGGRDWLSANPADKVEFFQIKLAEPEIYSPKQVAEFFEICREKDRDLIPVLVLLFFCGVRPDHNSGEITKATWEHILLEEGDPRVELPAAITKTGRRRTIKLRTAPLAWLKWWISTGGNPKGALVASPGEIFKKRLYTVLRSKVGLDDKPVKRIKDGTRKTFASYLARAETKDTAIKELGHSGAELLDRHYRSDVTAAEAEAFWSILPEAPAPPVVRKKTGSTKKKTPAKKKP